MGYKKGWKCELCNDYQNSKSNSYHCEPCCFDICEKCYIYISTRSANSNCHNHYLNLVKRVDWECSLCFNLYESLSSLYCGLCDFDVCMNCFWKPYKLNEDKINVYEYYAEQSNERKYMYSTTPNIKNEWISNKVAFVTPNPNSENVVPVFRYYCGKKRNGRRFLISLDNNLRNGWSNDNHIAFYAFKEKQNGTVPVYQYHHIQNDGGWRFQFSVKNITSEYTKDGIAFWAYEPI